MFKKKCEITGFSKHVHLQKLWFSISLFAKKNVAKTLSVNVWLFSTEFIVSTLFYCDFYSVAVYVIFVRFFFVAQTVTKAPPHRRSPRTKVLFKNQSRNGPEMIAHICPFSSVISMQDADFRSMPDIHNFASPATFYFIPSSEYF